MHELHEYTTPRYFFILPAKSRDWVMIELVQNIFQLYFKLYFLCECSNGPNELHIAPHNGYSIIKLNEFVSRYGSYLQKTFNAVQFLCRLGGIPIPQIMSAKAPSNDAEQKLTKIQSFLGKHQTKLSIANSSSIQKQKTPQTYPIQGADLRELESYLERVDSTRTLGNLYRIITDDGHVRWVCQKHFDEISHNNTMTTYIKQIQAMNGDYDETNKQVNLNQLKLTGANVKVISEALKQGLNISKLILNHCSIYDTYFDDLLEIFINMSSVHCLEIINVNLLNYFGLSKYVCPYIKIIFSNHSLALCFNESYQSENNNLFIRVLTHNKMHRTLILSACDFLNNQRNLHECLDSHGMITELVLNHANNIEILNAIYNSKINNQLERLKLNCSLGLPGVAKHFCELLKTNRTIIELDLLDANGFSDEIVLENLFQTLKSHQSIKQVYLHISRMKSSDKIEHLLIDYLQHRQLNTHLRLSFSVISTELIQIFIEERRSLIHLEFNQCTIDENDIQQLQSFENDEHPINFDISQEKYSFLNIPINSKWKLNPTNPIKEELRYPSSLYMDSDQTMYIVDSGNNRILALKDGDVRSQTVAGDNEQLDWPTKVIIDKRSNSMIICDSWNRRIVRWSCQNGRSEEVIISNITCHDVVMDHEEYLYVSDWKKHEITRWKIGDEEGIVVAGEHESHGRRLSRLDSPYYICVDRDQSVFVSDCFNERVVKWRKDATEGIVVANKELLCPRGLVVDEFGTLYIADQGNHRVIRWLKGATEGEIIIQDSQLNSPEYLLFDKENNLFIVDYFNHKILKFDYDVN